MKTKCMMVVFLVASLSVFGMKGMDGNDSLAAQAEMQVKFFLTCFPIFEIAMQERGNIFQEYLGEFRTGFQNRFDNNSMKENSAFIKVMGAELARRKAACLDSLKDAHFVTGDISLRQDQLAAIEGVFADFITSYKRRKSGDEDASLPIFQGKDSAPRKHYDRVPEFSLWDILSSTTGTVIVGTLFLATAFCMSYP